MPENVQTYKYTGINNKGKKTEGLIQGADAKDAQALLRKQGIEVIKLTPKRGFRLRGRGKKIKIKDVQLFTRFLSTMLSSGLPIIQALDIIGHDQENKNMQTLIMSIKNDIAGGKTLAETFAQYPKHFNDLYTNLIKAGEKSGTLDKILNRLAGYMEKSEMLRRKIKKALTYPIAILSVALIVSGILLMFVVPQFENMFKSFGADLPFFTRMIVTLSKFLRAWWWAILIVGGIGIYFFRRALKTNEALKVRMDRWTLKMYVIGPVLRKGIIARFTRTLATTLEAGMPIVESMKSMAPIMGSKIYTDAVLRMCDDLNSGHTLSAAMISTGLFPNMAIQMISVGEASGRLSDMLTKIADYYEDEVNHIVDNLSALLEPLIMMVLGLVVGSFVVAMYLPIFKMGSLF